MSHRYLIEITTPSVISVIVVAETPSEAQERALRGEGNTTASWTEDATVTRSRKLES